MKRLSALVPLLLLAACAEPRKRESFAEFRRGFAWEPLTVAEFERLHRELQPPADEPWRSVPWTTNLLEARDEAAREGKPIFIWAMDGSPLGCG